MENRIRELDEAFKKADDLADRVQTYIAAGRGVPHHLMEASARADEDLLQKLLALQQARKPSE
jgi:hypothetical protein